MILKNFVRKHIILYLFDLGVNIYTPSRSTTVGDP